jgi:hypothetical protein
MPESGVRQTHCYSATVAGEVFDFTSTLARRYLLGNHAPRH